MTASKAADYIFENLDEFKAKHADTIARFESEASSRRWRSRLQSR